MATASTDIRPASAAPLPRAIRRGLGRVDHRLRMVGTVRGLGTVALVLAVGAALGMAADVAFVLPIGARWALWGAWIAAGTLALLATVLRPMLRRLTWGDLAAVAETGQPTLGERLTGTVALLRGRPHGSPELIAALVDDAAGHAGTADLTRAISARGAVGRLALGMLAATLVVAPAVASPDPFADLWTRFLAPWAGIDRVGRFTVEVTPGDRVVAIGADLPVAATVRPRFGAAAPTDDAWLEWTGADGVANRVKMAEEADTRAGKARGPRSFAVTLPGLAHSLTYRVASGPAASRRHRITAVAAPAVAGLTARVAPPAYTKRPAAPARDPARIEAWEDSRITLEVAANKPLKAVEVTWPTTEAAGKSAAKATPAKSVALKASADGTRWSATVAAEASGPFAFKLRDEHGLENRPEAPRRLTVKPDAPPTLAIATPDAFKETAPDDLLMVAVVAHDDVAVATCELHYTVDRSRGSTGPDSGHVAAPLAGLGTRSARGEAALSLKPLALKAGDTVSYRVRVADNRPAPRGPNVAWSGGHSLRIVAQADSLLARQGSAERKELRARLEAIRKATEEGRLAVEPLRYAADLARRNQGRWDEAKAKAVADREAAAGDSADRLQLLARDFADHPTFRPLARPTRQVAEVEVEAARATLEAARRADDGGKRFDELQRAHGRLVAVLGRLDELLRRFDELAKLDDDRRRLRALAERQDDLAARADEAAKDQDRAPLDALKAEQERLRRELDELLKNSPALKAEALAAQAREAADLAARARELAEAQREEARRTADDGRRAAALKSLAEQQRGVEDDARRLAIRVNEPLAQNERAPLNAEALARAIEPIERGDLEQARNHAQEAEGALARLRRDLEDVRDDPKGLARRLARREEALRADTVEAVREAREHPPQTPEGKAALAERLKPLADRQEAIARLAAAIPAPPEQKDVARNAAQTTARARDDFREPRPREVEGHQNEARDALNRLAAALPDANQRREKARQAINEARNRTDEVGRELERHLRETAPQPNQPFNPAKAAAELAQRVAPLAQREREAAALLAKADPEPRAKPQRDRAARRAEALADALDALRRQAPAFDAKADEPRPLTGWKTLGTFPIKDAPPFPADQPVDLDGKYTDRKGQPAAWKPATPVDNQGLIDLGQIYSREDNQAAFGYTEAPSPAARQASMAIGSDDTLTVWLNGKQVFDHQANRSYNAGADRVNVPLVAGVNRILVKCGNLNGDWKFSVALTPPPEGYRPITDWRVAGVFRPADNRVPADQPVDPNAKYADRKGQPAAWRPARPVNEHGAIDLAAIFEARDGDTAAYGHAEVKSPAARAARLLLGSNDTLTVWLNGKQVHDFQGSHAWAPDQARVDVALAEGVNRILVKCGNTGGPWMYSVALSDDPAASPRPETPEELARKEPNFQRLRESLPALQVAAKASLDRLQQKLDGQVPADDLAAELAADQRDLKADQAQAPADDQAAHAAEAADQRRIANALRNLAAPDAALAKAEAVRRAEEAARALDAQGQPPAEAQARGQGQEPAQAQEQAAARDAAAHEAVARAAEAATDLARRLADEQPARERAEALARAQRSQDAPGDPAAQARREHAIADELAQLPAEGKGQAADAVAHAAELADQAARPDAAAARPDPAALAEARDQAAHALADLAARQPAPPAEASPRARAEALAHAERALADDLQAAHDHAGATPDPAARQRALAEDLAPLAARQQALAEATRALPDPAAPKPGEAHPAHPKAGEADPKADPSHPHADADADVAQHRAADALAKADPAAANAAARAAANALDQLAQSLPAEPQGQGQGEHLAQGEHQGQGNPPGGQAQPQGQPPAQAQNGAHAPEDPALGVTPAEVAEAAGLERRERHIREGLQAILGERVEPQHALRERSVALGREAADLRDRSRELSPRAQGPANAAADLLNRAAPEAMDRAAEGLHQGRPAEALAAQRNAADLAEQAARQAEDTAAGLRADAQAAAPAATPGELAAAQAAQRAAGQHLAQAQGQGQAPAPGSAQATQAAAAAMHQAAQGLRAAAQSQPPGGPSRAHETTASAADDPQSTRIGKGEPELAELQAALRAKTGRTWGELPGHLRTEILQMSQGRYRDDYARLIELYFREIAADAPDRGARP